MASNIPLGTYVQDGIRVGPFYSGNFSNTVADDNGVITSSSNDNYGPGVLLSPQYTYFITPAEPNGAGVTTENNLVALTDVGSVTAPGNLTLRGDNSVTFERNGVVQFDVPRIVTVTVSGANATAGTRVTIFGYDYYMNPLQHTYVVSAQQMYPIITRGGTGSGSLSVPAKAFYQVNRVHVSAALPGNCQISLGCADVFGLPYRQYAFPFVTSVSWGLTGEIYAPSVLNPLAALGVFIAGDGDVATATTGDVRGLYGPSTDADGSASLIYTYYVYGADQGINQIANRQQLYMQQTGSPTPQGVVVAPLDSSQLYGVPQFYTGKPS